MYATLASMALLASTAFAASAGKAIVVNSCSYEVYMANVPSFGGGYDEIHKKLKSGDQYSQKWTQLSNGNGWSIKLGKDESLENIMQYEYTFHDDGIIWYDLSDVNGNPWNGNWEITANSPSSVCTPKQQAYRYSTDDAYGMQACAQDAVITVTLCSGDSASNGTGASPSPSDTTTAAPAPSTEAATLSTLTTPTPSEPGTSAFPTYHHSFTEKHANVLFSDAPSATTFATLAASSSVITSEVAPGITVTDIATEIVTEIVTATAYAKEKRHAHHRRHGHA